MNQMNMRRGAGLALAVLVAAAGAAPADAQQQAGERMTILVPNLAPQGGVRDRFGRDVARELRRAIENLHTHQTVTEREMNTARRRYDLSVEQLYDCVTARQLAMQQNWQIVVCGEYQAAGSGQVQVTASFVGAESGETFDVPPITVSERDTKQAAEQILETFNRWQTQAAHLLYCSQYMDSDDWESALRNCDQALAINPTSRGGLYMKSYILRAMDRQEEAYRTAHELLEIDALHEDALKLSGILATELNRRDEARQYFDRYMELNPGDVGVRLAIATDINNAGDPEGALRIAEQGMESNLDNLNLMTYVGHFAAAAAAQAEQAMSGSNGTATADPAKITEFYQTAARAYERVFDERGTETEPAILERLIIAKFKLGATEEAVALGRRATEARPDEARIWDAYSRALDEAGDRQAALEAIARAESLGMKSPSLTQRKATLQLRMGQGPQAVATLRRGVDEGQMDASSAFRTLFAHAYNERVQRNQLDEGLRLLEAAEPLAVAETDRLTRNFWMGYVLFQQGQRAHEPMTAESAARAKPLFERALRHFQAARGYERVHASADVPKFIENTERFIEIEEALIRRGR